MPVAEPWRDHTLVFISGLHRSGTTQLNETLATHPDVSGILGTGAPHDEGQHLQDVFPTARSHGGPGRFAFDPAAHLTERSPLATAAPARSGCSSSGARHWDLDRRVLIEKSPPNLIRMRFLQALYPAGAVRGHRAAPDRHRAGHPQAGDDLVDAPHLPRGLTRRAPPGTGSRRTACCWRTCPQCATPTCCAGRTCVADPAGSLDGHRRASPGSTGASPAPDLDARQRPASTRAQWAAIAPTPAPTGHAPGCSPCSTSTPDLAERFGYRFDRPARARPAHGVTRRVTASAGSRAYPAPARQQRHAAAAASARRTPRPAHGRRGRASCAPRPAFTFWYDAGAGAPYRGLRRRATRLQPRLTARRPGAAPGCAAGPSRCAPWRRSPPTVRCRVRATAAPGHFLDRMRQVVEEHAPARRRPARRTSRPGKSA